MSRRLVDGQMPTIPEHNNGGAPLKLTYDLIKEMSKLAALGVPFNTLCAYSGIDLTTVRRWIILGRKDVYDGLDTIYSALYHGLGKSFAEADVRDLTFITAAAQGMPAKFKEHERDDEKKGIKKGDLVLDSMGNPILLMPAIKPDWKAAAWKYEQRNKTKYGPAISGVDIITDLVAQSNDEDKEKDKAEALRIAQLLLDEDQDAE